MFTNTNSVTLCHKSVFAKLSGCQKGGFRKEDWIFCFFYVGDRETEKMEKKQKPYKIVFLKVVIQKWEIRKDLWFFKNCLTRFVSGREKRAHFRAHDLFCQQFFWTKTVKTRRNYKKCGFSGKSPKPKMWPSFWKSFFFDMCEKYFWKTVFFWKDYFHYFYSVFSRTQQLQYKNCVLKKTKNLWKIVGCFWTWQNVVFLVCFLRF